jgi:dipeptidyl aminopeptidase/acylaminoacyl peptidase
MRGVARHFRWLSLRRLAVRMLAGWLVAAGVARGAALDELVAALYRPMQADRVALSPDGERVAYTKNEKGELVIYLMAVGRPEKKFRIQVEDDRPVMFTREKQPARLRFMAWASPTRLVFAPTPYDNGARTIAPIYAVNADGSNPKTLADSDDFSVMPEISPDPSAPLKPPIVRATEIRGFAPGDRTTLLIEAKGKATVGRAKPIPTEIFSVDVNKGKPAALFEEFEDGRFYLSATGAPRLLYQHGRYDHTRSFRIATGGAWGRWLKLNEQQGGPVAKSFVVTVEGYFGERTFPLGVDADPDLIYYASNAGRDTLGVYALDLRTKQRTTLALEDPNVDLAALDPDTAGNALVRDDLSGKVVGVRATGVTRFTRWVDRGLEAVQAELDGKFSQRTVEILQWDAARERFLLRVTGGIEPGRYYVYQRPEKVFVEILRAAPWLRNSDLHGGTTFAFDAASGVHLTGNLTFPRKPRLNPPPLLIDFSDGIMGEAKVGFDRETQILAEMGFVVARINHRGMSGFGRAHRDALKKGGDHVPVEDALAAIEWIAAHYAIDRKRIATIGHGLGGYVALRALQWEPEVFRCAIAIDAPLSPELWLQPPMPAMSLRGLDSPASSSLTGSSVGRMPPEPPINFTQEARRAYFAEGTAKLKSVLSEVERLTKPVMLIVNAAPGSEILIQNDSLRSRLKRQGRAPEYLEAKTLESEDLAGESAARYRKIEQFFNLNLYDFNVKVGPTKEVK